jgi:hypothetical protein
MEYQRLLVLHLGQSKGYVTALTHHHHTGPLDVQKRCQQYHICIIKMNTKQLSTFLGFASWIIKQQ